MRDIANVVTSFRGPRVRIPPSPPSPLAGAGCADSPGSSTEAPGWKRPLSVHLSDQARDPGAQEGHHRPVRIPAEERCPEAAVGRWLPLVLVSVLAACAPTRSFTVKSNPSGATVRIDGTAAGATPVTVPFEHHGTRRVTLYLEDYLVWSEAVEIEAPWWATFPLDLITDNLVPWRLRDEHELEVALTPAADRPGVEGIDAFLQRTASTHAREREQAREGPGPASEQEPPGS